MRAVNGNQRIYLEWPNVSDPQYISDLYSCTQSQSVGHDYATKLTLRLQSNLYRIDVRSHWFVWGPSTPVDNMYISVLHEPPLLLVNRFGVQAYSSGVDMQSRS